MINKNHVFSTHSTSLVSRFRHSIIPLLFEQGSSSDFELLCGVTDLHFTQAQLCASDQRGNVYVKSLYPRSTDPMRVNIHTKRINRSVALLVVLLSPCVEPDLEPQL